MKKFKLSKKLSIAIFIVSSSLPFANMPVNATHTEVNGCGGGPTARVTPNRPSGVSFEPACNNHDRCYGIVGQSRADCDNRFHTQMLDACRISFPDGRIFGKSVRKPQRTACNGAADVYFGAVKKFGNDAYNKAQNHARGR